MKKILLFLLVTPGLAWSADTVHHTPSFSDLLVFIINFTIFCGLLIWLTKDKIVTAWIQRSEEIEQAVNKGARLLAQANSKLATTNNRLAKIDLELKELESRLSKETEADVIDLKQQNNLNIERLNASTKQKIAVEKQASLRLVKNELAAELIDAAEKKLKISFDVTKDVTKRAGAFAKISNLLAR